MIDFVPPIYRDTVIETGLYPTFILKEIEDILAGADQ